MVLFGGATAGLKPAASARSTSQRREFGISSPILYFALPTQGASLLTASRSGGGA